VVLTRARSTILPIAIALDRYRIEEIFDLACAIAE
jgi:hypothetical protein